MGLSLGRQQAVMSSKQTAAGASGVGPNRRKWDVEEYTQKARDRDREEHERIQENEERQGKGQKPVKRRREELAKPTQDLQAREKDLELTKNEGKTLMVDSVPGGRKGPGFYCETCNRTFKDSIAYLDHVNGRLREFIIAFAIDCAWLTVCCSNPFFRSS